MPRHMYIYIRVSHEESAESGLGLEAQYRSCMMYADYKKSTEEYADVEIVTEPFTDAGVSAYLAKTRVFTSRPAGSRLNSILRDGDHVIFARMDRAFRWVPEFMTMLDNWKARGVTMHFVDLQIDMSTATGTLMASLMVMIAQWHSAYISEQTRAGLDRRKARLAASGKPDPRKVKKSGITKIKIAGGKTARVGVRQQEAVIRWLIYMRDQAGWTFIKISNRLEEILSRREGRKKIFFDSDRVYRRKLLSTWYNEIKREREQGAA